MNATEYQRLAARTLIDAPGFEISDLVKKGIFHQHGLDRARVRKELGDVLWYAAALATKLGLDLGDVMQANIDKLRQRYPNGWSSADSMRRVDVDRGA